MRKGLMIGTTCLLLSGCSFIPSMGDFGLSFPSSYPDGPSYDPALSGETEETLQDIAWFNFYQDETLKNLISLGLDNNNSLKTAAFSIEEARALYGIQKSDLIPDVSLDGAYTRQKINANSSGRIQGPQGAGGAGGQSFIFDNYSVNLGFTAYELDFFGRVRSLNTAALNDYLSTISALETVRISLISDIAAAYTSLRANQSLLKLAEDTLETRKQSYDLIAKRAEEGISTDLELAQAETLLLQARVDLYEYLNAIAQDKNALRLLIGTPEEMPDLDSYEEEYLNTLGLQFPVGMPSDLLVKRPDIIEAEYQLYSANADIGAARAAFFPRVSLTTTGGYTSSEFDNLFDNASQVWTFSPQISLPIFTGGRLKNNLDLAEIRKDIAVVNYENTIEVAFREVSDALSAVSTFDERVRAQSDLVAAATRRTELSTMRYDAGIENYLAVLDSKRELYTAQQNLILQKAGEINSKITLYKAVGGGAVLNNKK